MIEETASEAMRKTASFEFYTSGSPGIDRVLGGGFRAGRVTEVFGRSSSGKSLLAAQSTLLASKMGRRSLYIDTEGSFRPERLQQVAEARGWGLAGLLERIMYVRTDSAPEQMETIRQMATRNATSACGLVVVDTLTRNFSVELPGRSNLSGRQGALDVHLSEMTRDAYLNNRAYLVTNRVTFGTVHDVAIGGRTVDQLVHSSIRLEREGANVKAVLGTGESVTVGIGTAGID
jgi:DNA repair protein RadA